MLEKLPIEPAPVGEELKARAFKDGLTAQLYVQRGMFWDAVRELRERRGITAKKGLPPSGDNVSEFILPERSSGDDFVAQAEEWIADLQRIEQRCVPTRFQGSASGETSSPLAFCLILLERRTWIPLLGTEI
jgi:hypothetical protein